MQNNDISLSTKKKEIKGKLYFHCGPSSQNKMKRKGKQKKKKGMDKSNGKAPIYIHMYTYTYPQTQKHIYIQIHICTYTHYLFLKSDNNFWQYFWHYISVVVIRDYLQLLEVRQRFIF